MEIEICTIGGYEQVGKNMTAVRIDNEVIIIDMGIYLPAIINYEGEDWHTLSANQMIDYGALPNDNIIKEWIRDVKAIILGHCHLDHIAGVPYLSAKYRAPIYGTPFTIEVLKTILDDENIILPNKMVAMLSGKKVKISKNIEFEFVNVTHSTLQTVMIAIHTLKGTILYANDFKLDNHPVLGKKPDYLKLKDIGKNGVLCLIVESLYPEKDMKTPSEKVARELIKDVLLGVDNKGKAIFVATFASHLARIRSAIDFGKSLNRRVVLLGRSMGKYVSSAEHVQLIEYSKEAQICGYSNQIKATLRDIDRNRGKYLVVCTGSQGEPSSILDKLINKQLPFRFKEGDHVIFSCKTIPSPLNITNRQALEDALKKEKVRLFLDIHQSGHAAREDLRDFINLVKPKNIIPAHGELHMEQALENLAKEMGYHDSQIHVMGNGKRLIL